MHSFKPLPENLPRIPITVGQALLLLIERNRQQNKLDDEMDVELMHLYLVGAENTSAKEKILRYLPIELFTNDPLFKKYKLCIDAETISNDPSRRFFETHLAYHSMQSKIDYLSLDKLKKQFKLLRGICKKRNGMKSVMDDVFSNSEDTNKKSLGYEYQEILNRIDPIKITEEAKSEAKFIDDFSFEQRQKLWLLVACSFLSILIVKYVPNIPLQNEYREGFYSEEKRGREIKRSMGQVKSFHLGLMKSYHPVPRNDIAYNDKPFHRLRAADNCNFIDELVLNSWSNHNFKEWVHPFSCSISGSMLGNLRILSSLKDINAMEFNYVDELILYFQLFISISLFTTGGHSLNEYAYPLKLKNIQNAFNFVEDFSDIDLTSMFFEGNMPAFEKAIDETIAYNKTLLQRKTMHTELSFFKPTLNHVVTKVSNDVVVSDISEAQPGCQVS